MSSRFARNNAHRTLSQTCNRLTDYRAGPNVIEKLQELVNADKALVRRGRWLSVDMMIEIGDTRHLVKIREGRIADITQLQLLAIPFDFAVIGTSEAWTEFWKPVPKPRHHDIMALIRERKMRIEGDLELMMAHFLTLKLMLEKPRLLGATEASA